MKKLCKESEVPFWESEIAMYWWYENVLISESKPVLRTVENITQNAELLQQITNRTPVPLLIYLTASPIPDKATRKLSSRLLSQNYSAIAMVSSRSLATLVMKMVFALLPSPIPIKVFATDTDALRWLQNKIKNN